VARALASVRAVKINALDPETVSQFFCSAPHKTASATTWERERIYRGGVGGTSRNLAIVCSIIDLQLYAHSRA